MSVLGLLVTGPEPALYAFHIAVCFELISHTRRGNTVHYGCMEEHKDFALTAARAADVTVQEIVTVGHKNKRNLKLGGGAKGTVQDCIEEYPVLHLGTHGEKWEHK